MVVTIAYFKMLHVYVIAHPCLIANCSVASEKNDIKISQLRYQKLAVEDGYNSLTNRIIGQTMIYKTLHR